ncbi:hypothetical protein C5B76_10750 [Aeromonas salmonicida]|nr:hypothetical protein C5B76_10750 [Aeromonas salmonicida]
MCWEFIIKVIAFIISMALPAIIFYGINYLYLRYIKKDMERKGNILTFILLIVILIPFANKTHQVVLDVLSLALCRAS